MLTWIYEQCCGGQRLFVEASSSTPLAHRAALFYVA